MYARLSVLSLLLSSLAGCLPYLQPRPDEPHALVKVRVAYHESYGSGLQHAVYLNALSVSVPLPKGSVETPYTTSLRVAPGRASWRFTAAFHHEERRMSQRLTPLPGPVSCSRPPTSAGADSPLHGPLAASCTSQPAATQTEFTTHSVVDADCTATTEHEARAGEVYLLQYDFYGDEQCSLRCYEQREADGGEFELLPCST